MLTANLRINYADVQPQLIYPCSITEENTVWTKKGYLIIIFSIYILELGHVDYV